MRKIFTDRLPSVLYIVVFCLTLCLCASSAIQAGGLGNPTPVQMRALTLDPVFLPTKMADTFHMNPVILYNNEFLKPFEYDLDFAIGSFGTDFEKAEKEILLEESSDNSIYSAFGWRYGICESIGALDLPVEIYTQLPIFWNPGDFRTWRRATPNVPFSPVGETDDDLSLGKWIWGLRFGLLGETDYLPSIALQTSIGIPVDDTLASDSIDADLRLNFEKHLGHGFVGTFYTGGLIPGDGKEVITELGVHEDNFVPYVGMILESNYAQLLGQTDPGSLWFFFGGSWRDSLYDFGSHGPDYAEEEMKLTGGLSFDLGYWGRFLGCPQGMLGLAHTVHGGPEKGETEALARINFPYRYHMR